MLVYEQDLRENFTPRSLLEWLLSSDHYFILGHIHQGIDRWNVTELYHDMSWLRTRSGFPSHNQLSCPVFTQDKFAYIKGCSSVTIPTLKVDMQSFDCENTTRKYEYSRGPNMTLNSFLQV